MDRYLRVPLYLLSHRFEVARYRLLGEYVIAGHPLDYAALHIPGKVVRMLVRPRPGCV
jgi:hypothetical protein